MRNHRLTAALCLVLGLLPACSFLGFGDDDGGDDSCNEPVPGPSPPSDGIGIPSNGGGLRDPQAGTCQFFGGNCGGPVPDTAERATSGEVPDWGVCGSPCEQVTSEDACRQSDACRAIYVASCTGGAAGCSEIDYAACWPTAPSGPVRGSECVGLDAQECSRHDDCVAVHLRGQSGEVLDFVGCQNEIAPAPSCGALSEADCISRSDCAPVYQGADCSCTPAGCHCNSQFFLSCTDGGSSEDLSCGPYSCRDDQYCEHGEGGAAPGVSTYACKPLPSACAAAGAGCDCLSGESCGYSCTKDDTGFTLTCQYP
jgi:hypothetical protein